MNVARSAGAAVLLVCGAGALAYFGMRSDERPKPVALPQPKEQPAPVVKPAEQNFTCRIVPQQAVWASTPVTGPLEAVYADVGQMVTDGQVLARVKSGTVTPALAGMEQDASQDHVREVTARLSAARAESKRLQSEATQARTTLTRIEPLFRKQELLNQAGATPRLVYENSRAEHQRAVQDLSAAEEASRQADNSVSRVADELAQAAETAKEKAKATVSAAAGIATAEIHAPAAGLLIERKIAAGENVTEVNRMELFRIAVHPELLRAEFDAGAGLHAGEAVTIHAGDAQVRAVMTDGVNADFESHLGSVTMGTACTGNVRIK